MPIPQSFSEASKHGLINVDEVQLEGMIRNITPARPTSLNRKRKDQHTSLGKFDILPPEILLLILEQLDFQSLSRLSRVSYNGLSAVSTLPAYVEMMTYAPDTLAALGKTRMLAYFPAELLRYTLRSVQCVSCFDFGAFLFLPTCERVCFECLDRNHALHVMPLHLAKQVFQLENKHLKSIPVVRSIPASYNVRWGSSYRRILRLVSVKQVKKIALDIHGSFDHLLDPERNKALPEASSKKLIQFKQYLKAPLEPPGSDMSKLPGAEDSGAEDTFAGMASIRFPHLSETGPDRGYLCKGCFVTVSREERGLIPEDVLSKLVPQNILPTGPLEAAMYRLRTANGFLLHIKQCYGAHLILKNEFDEIDLY